MPERDKDERKPAQKCHELVTRTDKFKTRQIQETTITGLWGPDFGKFDAKLYAVVSPKKETL